MADIIRLDDYRKKPFLELDLEPEIGPGVVPEDELRGLAGLIHDYGDEDDFGVTLKEYWERQEEARKGRVWE